MLPQVLAERQLAAIEASLVPHLKPEAANRIIERHKRTLQPPRERKTASSALLDAFRQAGLPVEEVPTKQ